MARGKVADLMLRGVIIPVGILGLAASAVSAAPQTIAQEPPAEYTLTINGKAVPLSLEQETQVGIGRVGGKARLKLSRKPTRTFDKFGVKFVYPAAFSFEVDTSEPEVVNWTMAGVRSSVTLQRSPRSVPALLLNLTTWQIVREYGAKNSKTTPASIVLGGRKLSGKRIVFTVGTAKVVQQVFAFSHLRSSFILIFQDELSENGKISTEGAQLKKLFLSSFSMA